jgi:hypothetical protein
MRNSKRFGLALISLIALAIALGWQLPAKAWLGDIDLNNLVNQADLNAIAQRLGSKELDPDYPKALDLNLDGKINVADLAIAGRSYGAPRIFHYTRQISNCPKDCAYEQDSCLDGLGRINIIWRSSENVYFSRLDRFGNTLIDDVTLSSNASAAPLGIACDSNGTAHLFWKKGAYLYQARFDRWGYPVIPPQKAYSEEIESGGGQGLGAGLDSHGNAFAFFMRYWTHTPTLLRISPEGELAQFSVGSLNGASNTTSLFHRLAVDAKDNLHLMWYELEGTERFYYARYAADDSVSLNAYLVGYTNYDGFWNAAKEGALEVDGQGNAYLMWRKHGTTKLFLEKIAPDGTTLLDDYELFTQWGNDTVTSDLDIDDQGKLHLVTVTNWGKTSGVSRSAYGTFRSTGEPLDPLRWILYKAVMNRPRVMVDNQQDVHITFASSTSPSGYPPCPINSLCYLGSAFEATAYDLSRSDLGVDAAHLTYQPLIARWGSTLAITTTVFNEGWANSTPSTLWIGLESEAGQTLTKTSQPVNALAPHAQQNFSYIQLSLPALPPEGMEEMEYLRLHFWVDPQNALAETSEDNNQLWVPILVQKLPTKTGLFLIVEDETNTARGGVSERVNVGKASIQGGSYLKTDIQVQDDITVLGKDIPVTNDLVNYTIAWQATGYAIPTPAVLGVRRNGSNPYQIDYSPSNTAVLKTNRWGSLSGTITNGGGASVRVVGQGLNIETFADGSGSFSPATEPKLGKLIPGEYQIRISKAGYARQIASITIAPLGIHTHNVSLETTTDAYLHGNVVNEFGNPIANAQVDACGTTTQTDAQGIFDLTVSASCKNLSITRSGYAALSQLLSLTAGLETLLTDVEMTFDPPVTLFSQEGRVASRVIDQSTGGLLPEPPPDASWAEKQIYDQFKSKFWPEYRIYLAYGAYAYNAAAAYSGPSNDRRMQFIQVSFEPQTFEVHAFLPTVDFLGAPITLPIVSDSGIRSAILVIEARLVNVKTGQVLQTVKTPIEGSASEWIFSQGILTYDFSGTAISDWDNTEVWLYYKVGKNESGQFSSPPQLYQHDRQIMKFDLSSGEISLNYGLGEFPLP